MSRLVIDSYAWIEYLDGTEKGRTVSNYLDENEEIFSCALTIAEVISKAARKGRSERTAYEVLTNNSKIISADQELSFQAGLIHCQMRKTVKDFGLADAYVLATAEKLDAKILTGDNHFKNIKEAILLT